MRQALTRIEAVSMATDNVSIDIPNGVSGTV
jgi:hypothetical protein